ncbi:hypothetical protein GQ53DRAFT_459332 [Thozetella sp. PMI_491]|nr:hypothetical protein GQ53DRAFT_459332 [Thozetella sp. PMI_491]
MCHCKRRTSTRPASRCLLFVVLYKSHSPLGHGFVRHRHSPSSTQQHPLFFPYHPLPSFTLLGSRHITYILSSNSPTTATTSSPNA